MTRYSIGELARRTGLSVKAVRRYADRGLVPPAGRNAAGHRVFDAEAAVRLRLLRTLRQLGVGLATIHKLLERELTLAEVAAAHAEALDVQIRALRLRRAVLATIDEENLMHRLAAATEAEQQRLVGEFLDTIFAGVDPAYAGVRTSLTPVLPDDPGQAQVEAWLELVDLAADPQFQAKMRQLVEQHAADRRPGELPRPDAVAVVRQALPRTAVNNAPTSAAAAPAVTTVLRAYAGVTGEPDGPALRRRLLHRLELADDARRVRYLRLLSSVNGWPAPDTPEPALAWCIEALRVN